MFIYFIYYLPSQTIKAIINPTQYLERELIVFDNKI